MPALTASPYQAELQRIEDDIDSLGPGAIEPPIDVENATKYAHRLCQRASLNGDLRGLRAAERAMDTVIPQLRRGDDLLLLKASLCFKLHRLDGVRAILEARPDLCGTSEGRKLVADLHFQEGRYREARQTYLEAIAADRSWDNLARYAHYVGKFESAEAADELYSEAEEELTSKQMRSFAWVELQRGVLDLERGRFDDAEVHYETAGRAYPGYWMVTEHQAGLLAQRGDVQAAAAMYEDLCRQVHKPELLQILGALYRHMGDARGAQPYLDRALAAFEESAACGEVHYYHHLVDFHSEITHDYREAIRWAAKDLELRNNYSTQAALAWALHRNGESEQAIKWLDEALNSGVQDAHLFAHAAAICKAVGQQLRADDYHHRSHAMNSRPVGFHTHH
jgi:tetratricopeptide (TPR) repeat protein